MPKMELIILQDNGVNQDTQFFSKEVFMTSMLKLGTTLSCSVLEINLLMLKSDLFVLQMEVQTLLELFVTSGEVLKICR
jgi:hypothetical protein